MCHLDDQMYQKLHPITNANGKDDSGLNLTYLCTLNV